jgi:hypothetical protein
MFWYYIVQKIRLTFHLEPQKKKATKKDVPKCRESETVAAEMSLQGQESLG